MKKFLFAVSLSLSTLSVAETTPANHNAGKDLGANPLRSVVKQEDKSAKLQQYIDACLVKRPSADEEIRNLFK